MIQQQERDSAVRALNYPDVAQFECLQDCGAWSERWRICVADARPTEACQCCPTEHCPTESPRQHTSLALATLKKIVLFIAGAGASRSARKTVKGVVK